MKLKSQYDFEKVYAELDNYRKQHDGSLIISIDNAALARIVDSLISCDIEDLARKRWSHLLKELEAFKEEHGHIHVPVTRPTLGDWVREQLNNYKLHLQNLPNPLTKKRAKLLADIGVDEVARKMIKGEDDIGDISDKKEVKIKEEQENSNHGQDKMENLPLQTHPINNNSASNYTGVSGTGQGLEPATNDTTSAEGQSEHKGNQQDIPSINTDAGSGWRNEITSASLQRAETQIENVSKNSGNQKYNTANRRNINCRGSAIGVKSKIAKPKCDLCMKPDGFRGHILQTCKICGLHVHELCYATIPIYKHDPDFVCHACNAIGAEIEVNVPSVVGGCGDDTESKREIVVQNERPVHCVLCSYSGGIHAMHPIYDTDGPEGRQLLLPKRENWEESQLAWAHTLCAQVINCYPKTAGCVFGCDEEGNFEEEDSHEDYCYICDDGGDLVCCDDCTKAYHAECLQVDLDSLPDPWSCPKCTGELTNDRLKELRAALNASSKNDLKRAENSELANEDEEMTARHEKSMERDEGLVGKENDVTENGDDDSCGENENATKRVNENIKENERNDRNYVDRAEDDDGKPGDDDQSLEHVNRSIKNGVAEVEADEIETEENIGDENEDKITWTHRFVIAGTEDGDDKYSKAIREQRKNLICHVCGVKDSKHGTLRIPIQCIAGDDKEFEDWKRRHFELNINPNNTECSVAMHVGCSRWKINHEAIIGGKVKHIPLCYFYPGTKAGANAEEENKIEKEEINKDSLGHCYCRKHGEDIKRNKKSLPPVGLKRKLREKEQASRERTSKKAFLRM
mmetsp:Transcript_24416/g.49980  ORF Transcript_24416/g.49980 Transcript_24416/m.49980 type:complete len:801 (+) Transcript_24416:95-2497(+)